jgi:hypothetical protein
MGARGSVETGSGRVETVASGREWRGPRCGVCSCKMFVGIAAGTCGDCFKWAFEKIVELVGRARKAALSPWGKPQGPRTRQSTSIGRATWAPWPGSIFGAGSSSGPLVGVIAA